MRNIFTICRRSLPWTLGVCLAGLVLNSLLAAEVGSAFHYQGRLMQAGRPAQGDYDMQFNLFTASDGGEPCASTVTLDSVEVGEGLFSVSLDFGLDVFTGEGCWLEIGVRSSLEDGPFTLLTPRQRLAPAPYAVYTLKAESLTGPVPDSQLSTNVARLNADQTFTGNVQFEGNILGDGQGLSNVMATALSSRLVQRFWKISIPFVQVTNAANSPDFNGQGTVPYNFRMGKYEINNYQYTAFLNAVGAEDLHFLYDTNMESTVHGGIIRTGNQGEFHYKVKEGMGHMPVVWVDYPDVLRFCNWLHNGQPTGPMDATTTEDGAYTMDPATIRDNTIARNPGARYWLPSGDEWYKAAYHQPESQGGIPGDFWPFPTRSFDLPVSELPPGGNNSINACCETGMMATPVGAYTNTFSYYGVYDLGGNVQEWTEEVIFILNRRIRGGSWLYNAFYAESSDLEFDTTDYPADGIGFRVAGAAQP